MQKTIKLNSKQSLKLDSNVYWLYAYRNQFGRDITPVLVPALNAGIALASELLKAANGGTVADAIKRIPTEQLQDAVLELSGLEVVDLINIIWALAKCADDDIAEPEIWVRQFDVFPLDTVLPEVVGLVVKSMVSTKNWKALTELTTTAKG